VQQVDDEERRQELHEVQNGVDGEDLEDDPVWREGGEGDARQYSVVQVAGQALPGPEGPGHDRHDADDRRSVARLDVARGDGGYDRHRIEHLY
jgi:hypothetical protein